MAVEAPGNSASAPCWLPCLLKLQTVTYSMLKVKRHISLLNKSSQSYGVSLAIWYIRQGFDLIQREIAPFDPPSPEPNMKGSDVALQIELWPFEIFQTV